MNNKLSLAVAALMGVSAANAMDPAYVTLGTGYSENEFQEDLAITDGTMVIGDSLVDEVSIGYHVIPEVALELTAVLPGLFNDSSEAGISQYKVNGFYFWGENKLKPYLTTGFGFEQLEVPENVAVNGETMAFSMGAGLQYDITEKLFSRVEFRVDNLNDSHFQHNIYMAEVGYRFGWEDEKPATPVAAPVAAAPVAAPVIEPEPEPVVIDSDGDGVPDEMDRCVDTFEGATVTENGCAIFQGTLKGVTFENNSSKLTPEAEVIMAEMASELVKYPAAKVTIKAYTDSRGSVAYNVRLSQQRADSVRSYLIGQGLSEEQLTAEGLGPVNPVATNETAAGRAANRRVELVVE